MSKEPNSFHTAMKTVRDKGAAHDGTGHFWVLRVTALALVPLSIWFMFELMTAMVGADRGVIANLFRAPHVALLSTALIVALVIHTRLGVMEIITDYVHCEYKKIALILLNNAAALLIVTVCLFAIARLHFIGM